MNGTIRGVCCNVKRWRDASMALHWTAASIIEAQATEGVEAITDPEGCTDGHSRLSRP
jgi:hypothetical protein